MKIARLRNSGELELKNEIIEYPPELEGNRNLFAGLYTGHANHPNYNISRWTGAVVKIKPNTTYTVKRNSPSNRFQIMTGRLDNGIYAKMTQVTNIVGDYTNNHVDVVLTVTSGDNDEYLVVYLSNQGHFNDILLKVEEGSSATPYTPSPEELGLDYPDFIKKFNQKIYPHGVFLTPEIVEYPPELEGGRNLIKSTDDLHSWNGVVNATTTTGAFLYTSYNYRPAIYQIEARAIDENMVGAEFAWQWSSVIQGDSIILSNEWQRIVSPVFDIDGAIGLRVLGGTGKIELRQIKAERGNKATDWTPSPEELGFNYSEDISSFGIRPFGDMTMVSEIIEDCHFEEWFWLDFVPYDESTSGVSRVRVNSQIIPYDCTLHMSLVGNQQHECIWYINGESLRARKMVAGGGEWTDNQSISISAGDELYIVVETTLTTTTIEDTLILRLDDENGIKVAEFDFVLEPTCYLTTAMVGYFNKADDGIELTAMRELRSHSGYKYQDVLKEYAQASPIIIRGIEQSEDKDYYYNMIKDVVDNIVIWVADEEWEKAETAYLELYYSLKEKWGV